MQDVLELQSVETETEPELDMDPNGVLIVTTVSNLSFDCSVDGCSVDC
ncbi:hypothetical protein ABIA35_003409 [Catenulispora sp. MAP12-49]